jgi:hypothetical protein
VSHDRFVAAAVLTRPRGRARGKRVRFRDAVPVRRDRRDLRRQFRRAARAVTAEHKAGTTALLGRLSADRVPLSAVTPGARDTERIIEFLDGTRLLLATRHGTAKLERLERGGFWPPVWLAQARPDFTHRWFRLWFASASRAELVEVRAAVTPAAG